MQTLFWISLSLLFYTYVGYGLLLLIYNRIFTRESVAVTQHLPDVTVVIPAYNEEEIIRRKIENCLTLHYPKDKIFFLFITDGSTDRTAEIVGGYPAVQSLHQPVRKGKSAAINRAMEIVDTPLTVFTDANTMLHPESILKLVRHFSDPKVGGVSGEKRILGNSHSAVGFGEKIYWQYESQLKKANAAFYTILGAAGELFAIRSVLFTPLDEKVILDDFVISARICQQGYRFLYEKEAIAVEASSATLADERKRKIRISAGSFQTLGLLPGLLNPFKNLRVWFQYISHRVLRWVVCPVLLPAVFIANYFIVSSGSFYTVSFWAQILFYMLAFIGSLQPDKSNNKLLTVPAYFVFMILSQYTGFYRHITKKQTVFWEKAARETLPATPNQKKV